MSVLGIEITKNKIKFAYDTQTTMGNRKHEEKEQKVFQVRNLTVAMSGDTMYRQYLKRYLEETLNEEYKLNEPVDVCNLMDGFFTKHKENKHLDQKEVKSSTMLIADASKAYYFSLENYGCLEVLDSEFIGSGWELAQGAYLAFEKAQSFEENRLLESIKIACQKDIYCSEPVKIIEIDRK
jgi:ATP-dependent protease HslVU (ClpYQ) peptidase subunit